MSITISSFSAQYDFLSNFYPCDILYEGITYPSTEHAFQAAKTFDVSKRKYIASIKDPAQAKKMGRTVQLRADWERIKIQVMEDVLRIKFSEPVLASKLIATENADLVEGNWWGDTFWGVCKGRGKNNLGKLLMKIRSELKT